jgi:UDP-2,3-diacylglucosamine hydrolase
VTRSGDLVFVGDVHLDRDDADLDRFLEFLDGLEPTVSRLVLAGDLFNLWIGRRELEQPHQTAVLERFERMRGAGVVVRYIEGNRDFRIGPAYAGKAVDDSTDRGVVERFGGRSLFAAHGDLANVRDRQYRAWRRIARSRLMWALFNLIPRTRRLRFAESLEARMRGTNLDYKKEFPEADVREYAAGFLAGGHDAVVLGHFHLERDLQARPPSAPGRILVLPEWKEGGRYLRVTGEGEIRFEGASDLL